MFNLIALNFFGIVPWAVDSLARPANSRLVQCVTVIVDPARRLEFSIEPDAFRIAIWFIVEVGNDVVITRRESHRNHAGVDSHLGIVSILLVLLSATRGGEPPIVEKRKLAATRVKGFDLGNALSGQLEMLELPPKKSIRVWIAFSW